MININFYKKYNSDLFSLLGSEEILKFKKLIEFIKITKKNDAKIIIAGNGGSSAIASHVSVDFTKACNIRSINFNEADLITCFANDYGYENWLSKAIEKFAKKKDLVILISSSGKSKNIINAANFCKNNKIKIITLSGFSKNNPLSKIGDINFWCNSYSYNKIEMTHHIWLLMIVDYLSVK
jgi:D-sedoheptulose 7-phosphate isomerase